MDPFLKDILTLALAGISFILSTVSLTLWYMNYRREGGILKFGLDYERKNSSGVFLLKIENKGFHIIKIDQIRMIVRNKVIQVIQKGFELDYGKSEVVKILLTSYKDFDPIEVNRIEVVDIEDKVYKINTKQLRSKIRR